MFARCPSIVAVAKAAEIREEDGKPAHDPGAGVNEAVLWWELFLQLWFSGQSSRPGAGPSGNCDAC